MPSQSPGSTKHNVRKSIICKGCYPRQEGTVKTQSKDSLIFNVVPVSVTNTYMEKGLYFIKNIMLSLKLNYKLHYELK